MYVVPAVIRVCGFAPIGSKSADVPDCNDKICLLKKCRKYWSSRGQKVKYLKI